MFQYKGKEAWYFEVLVSFLFNWFWRIIDSIHTRNVDVLKFPQPKIQKINKFGLLGVSLFTNLNAMLPQDQGKIKV